MEQAPTPGRPTLAAPEGVPVPNRNPSEASIPPKPTSTEATSVEGAPAEGTTSTVPITIDTNVDYSLPSSNGEVRTVKGNELLQEINRGYGYRQLQSQNQSSQDTARVLSEQVQQLQQQLADRTRESLKQQLFTQPSVEESFDEDTTDYPFTQQSQQLTNGAPTINQEALGRVVDQAYDGNGLSEDRIRALMQEEFLKQSQAQADQQQQAALLDAEMRTQTDALKTKYNLSDQQTTELTTQVEAALENMMMVGRGVNPISNYANAFNTLVQGLVPQIAQYHQDAERQRVQDERNAAILEPIGSHPSEAVPDDIDDKNMNYQELRDRFKEQGKKRYTQVRGIG